MSADGGDVVDLVDLDEDAEDLPEKTLGGIATFPSPRSPKVRRKRSPKRKECGLLDLDLSSSEDEDQNDEAGTGAALASSALRATSSLSVSMSSTTLLSSTRTSLSRTASTHTPVQTTSMEMGVVSLITTEKRVASKMPASPVSILSVSPKTSPTRKRVRPNGDAERVSPPSSLSSAPAMANGQAKQAAALATAPQPPGMEVKAKAPARIPPQEIVPPMSTPPPGLSDKDRARWIKTAEKNHARAVKAANKHRQKRHADECKLAKYIKFGKHAQREIVALFSSRLAKSPVGSALQGLCIANDIDFQVEPCMRSAYMVAFGHRHFLQSEDNPDQMSFRLNEKSQKPEPVFDASALPAPIANAVLLFWDADDFVQRLCRDSTGYTALESVVTCALADWKRMISIDARPRSQFTKDLPKVIVILRGGNEAVLRAQKRCRAQAKQSSDARRASAAGIDLDAVVYANPARATQGAVADALAWLFTAYGCEHRMLLDDADKTHELFKMYIDAVASALHYRPKAAIEILAEFKSQGSRESDWGTGTELGEFVSQTWYYMLKCVVGDVMARRVVRVYPSMRCLVDVYQDESRSEVDKEHLLEDILSGEDSNRRQTKSSRLIYRLFTTRDPNLVLR